MTALFSEVGQWTARQAELTGAAVEAILAWQLPAFYDWVPVGPEDIDFVGIAQQVLTGALDDVFGRDHPAWLRASVVEGHAAQVLVEASAGAELLVVGTRGYGVFSDAMLGSVSTYCVHHAHCPVTVIRPAGTVIRPAGHTAASSPPDGA